MEIGIVTAYMIQISWWEVTNIYMEEVSPKIKTGEVENAVWRKIFGEFVTNFSKNTIHVSTSKVLISEWKKPNERLNI